MNKIIFIDFDTVKAIHNAQIYSFGGLSGIRDNSLLESSVNMPKSSFDGKYLYPINKFFINYSFYLTEDYMI